MPQEHKISLLANSHGAPASTMQPKGYADRRLNDGRLTEKGVNWPSVGEFIGAACEVKYFCCVIKAEP